MQGKKNVIAAMLANGLEWYDYALYAFMTLTISRLFFPTGDADAHLLATLGIFAVGFIARPFGGILFGMIGDRYGRRVSLAASILLMAIPTGCIGLLPTYAQIGIWAPVLLTLIRILQGLSLGGAFSGSMTYLVEHAAPTRRGLTGSASIMSLVIGFLLGSLVSAAVKSVMDDAQFESFGWRIPFLLGVLVGFVGFYIRHHCEESPIYVQALEQDLLSKRPLRDLWANHKLAMVRSIAAYTAVTMPFYTVSAFFVTYTERSLGHSKEETLLLSSLNMLVIMILAPLSGWLSDRYGRRRVILSGCLLFLIFPLPLLSLMIEPGLMPVLLAQAGFAALIGLYTGAIPALLVELYPTSVRNSGMAVAYNIAAVVFGGTAPMVCEWLVQQMGNIYAVGWYVMACAAFSFAAMWGYRDRWRDLSVL